MRNKNWSREEIILAIMLYQRVSYSTATNETPEILELAALIGRSPGAVRMKLGNITAVESKGAGGLRNINRLDQTVWDEFSRNPEQLFVEGEKIRKLFAEGLRPTNI